MSDQQALEAMFREHNFDDFKWIDPRDIIVAQWVRMKCIFGCSNYGRNATCPPNVPTVAECRQFFSEYTRAAVFHFEKGLEKPEDRHKWTRKVNLELLKVERAVFLAGYEKAFLLFMDSCGLCADCSGAREKCKNPESARPGPDSMAIDVYSTVRKYGYPIEVLKEYSQLMNRYAFLLIE